MKTKLGYSSVFKAVVNAYASGDYDTFVCEGGTRSTKTISIIQMLINFADDAPNLVINIFRRFGVTLEKTVVADFRWVLSTFYAKLESRVVFTKQPSEIRFPNGSVIRFIGADDEPRLRGLSGDIAWLEEANEIAWQEANAILMRTSRLVFISFNPTADFWAHSRFRNKPTTFWHHSTYLDNPWLSKKIVAEIESWEPTPMNKRAGTADSYSWQVFGLGKLARAENAIYRDFIVIPDSEFPTREVSSRWGVGLDFGWADPTACVEWRLYQGRLYIRELIYESHLLTSPNPQRPSQPAITQRLTEAGLDPKHTLIYADSASPSAIHDLQASDWEVVPVKKGPGSILDGISTLRRFAFYITDSSLNLNRELRGYHWRRNRVTGAVLSEPDPACEDHLLDALRYSAATELAQLHAEHSAKGLKTRKGRARR